MKKTFQKAEMKVVYLENDIIATSDTVNCTVDDPWSSNSEENW